MKPKYQFAVLCAGSVLATLPIWLSHYPMMVDVPQHAAEIALLRQMQDSTFHFSHLFEYHWFTPYWLGYMLVYLLAPITGISTGLKLVVSLALASFPISAAILIRQMEGDEFWAWLCIPGMYGFAYQWGLLNFLVATPFGLLFLALVAWYVRASNPLRGWLLAASVLALFFCHALICALFGLIAAGYIAFESRVWKAALRNVAPLLAPLPLIFYYLVHTSGTPAVVDMATGWDLGWFNAQNDAYYSLLTPFGGRGRWDWGRISGFFPRLLGLRPSLSCVLIGLILLALPLLAGLKLNTKRLSLWVPLLVLAAALLLMPNRMLGNSYTYQRLTILALPFFALIWPPSEKASRRLALFRIVTIAIGFTCISVFAAQARVFDIEQSGFAQLVSKMAPNQRVLSLVLDRDSSVGIAPFFLHFPAWYTAEKGGLTDPSFASLGIEPVRFRQDFVPPARTTGFEWAPGWFDWNPYRGYDYRYFVVRFRADAGPYLFRHATCPIRLVDHVGEWWLYQTDSACKPPAATGTD